jgi:hypothetical protein
VFEVGFQAHVRNKAIQSKTRYAIRVKPSSRSAHARPHKWRL